MLRLIGFFVVAFVLAQLLSQVPLIGGFFAHTGIFGVWITAMLFFQAVLLAGYAYAHLTARIADIRWQLRALSVRNRLCCELISPTSPESSRRP